MKNRAQEFYKKVNRVNFNFQARVLEFGDLLMGWKLATNAKLHHNI